jgi:MYXO-CTERM domain-containing protein
MRNNTIVKGAVGAMLFGGTLGAASPASAGLTWNASGGGGGPGLIPVNSSNYAVSYDSGPNDTYLRSSTATGWNFEAYQGTVNGATGPTAISFSAVTSSGYSVSVSGSTASGYVNVVRVFTVTDAQQITISWTGRTGAATIGLANGPSAVNGWGTVAALSAQGWGASTQPTVPGGSQINTSIAGSYSYTVTLGAGNYYVANTVSLGDAGASMSFTVVPAPGALALLGVAGVVGSRRRR